MNPFPCIIGVSAAFPKKRMAQAEITASLAAIWRNKNVDLDLLEKFHRSVRVTGRNLAMPLADHETNPAERNQAFIDIGVNLAEKVVQNLLAEANILPRDVSQIISTTVTGVTVPTIEARLMNRLPFSPSLKRVPLFGLGCVGGAAGIARAADYLRGHPDDVVILLALELCSLTFQADDVSVANMVASSLFGDGCAAVLLFGKNREVPLDCFPAVVDSCSFFFPDSERVMGFDINDAGFKIVLSGQVPEIAQEKIPPCVDQLLGHHHLHRNDIAAWIAHPGGPKVMEALIDGLCLPQDALSLSYESLADYGNLSSASVLEVLQRTLKQRSFRQGDYGVLLAMGPAFCAEVILLKW